MISQIAGKVFCITGKLNFPGGRDALMQYINTHGGFNSVSAHRGVDYLISSTTPPDSMKYKAAAELGCAVISEAEFMRMSETTMDCEVE